MKICRVAASALRAMAITLALTPCPPAHLHAPRVLAAGYRAHDGRSLSAAVSTLRAYADAFTAGRYGAMWALLAPAARATWDSPRSFAAYYRTKFAPVRVRGTSTGSPRVIGRTVHVPLSLDLAWRGAGPPGVLDLFNNVDAVLVPARHGWRVAGGGPLDPAAPFVPPPHPAPHTLRVPILMYHHISDVPPPAPSQIGLTVTDAAFTAQLDYLAGHGYHTVLLVDLYNALYYGRPLPPHPVILTFDDGYLDNYTDAYPLLRRHGMVGEFNIITAYPGKTVGVNSYMTWTQIEALAAAGMEMESHTIDHQDLGAIDTSRAIYELHISRAVLAAKVHRAVQFLAYPSGEPFRSGTLEAQQRILALLPRFGYVGALLDPVAPSALQSALAPYNLPRVRVSPGETPAAFAADLQS